MNELSSLGLILLLALGAGHIVKFARIPEVSGYIVAGIVLGPSVLGWVSQQNLSALEILSEVALGLILFSVGTVFELSRFRRVGRQVLLLTLIESALAAVIVTTGMLALGQPWKTADVFEPLGHSRNPPVKIRTQGDKVIADNLQQITDVFHDALERAIFRPR